MRRRQSEHARWKRRRAPAPRFKPNDTYMRAYEERIILSDILIIGGSFSAADLRKCAPGRYSVKLQPTLKRMARPGGCLMVVGGVRSHGRITPRYLLLRERAELAA